MLYVVGDSNSVYTSHYIMTDSLNNQTLCRVGWTTEDVLRAVTRAPNLGDVTVFFVFVGLNDQLTGDGIATNVLQIISTLRARRSSPRVPIFLAPPFCVKDATPMSQCTDRRDAARRLWRELREDQMGCILLTPHVTREMYAKKEFQVRKPGSKNIDPLHLNASAYMHIANGINQFLLLHTPSTKRKSKPKRIYEAGPAPPPTVAKAMALAVKEAKEAKEAKAERVGTRR